HYHELTELERYLPRVRNCNVAVLEEGDRVVFLHKIISGGADRSYGLHVAQLAGVPRAVTRRARELLERLERERQSPAPSRRGRTAPSSETLQIPLFGPAHPVVEELSQLDIDSMTPLEAIAKLYELRRRAQDGLGPGETR
ncbi:MAG: DNA mismatch repair protein MutS, partial [Chloroflexi bacterium]|nr:DNA mismatch repair protein MutS [Chloroflexota bacterium]